MGQAPVTIILQPVTCALPRTSQSLAASAPASQLLEVRVKTALSNSRAGHGPLNEPLSLQQLPQLFQLLSLLGPGGNLFLAKSDCLGFFSIFPLSGKIVWMKENRAKLTFPHSWVTTHFRELFSEMASFL